MSEKLVYVALDNKGGQEAKMEMATQLVSGTARLPDVDFGFKINQNELALDGAMFLSNISAFGKPVFADLKMNNGQSTMSDTIRQLATFKVAHTNIWAQADINLRKTMEKVEGIADRPDILAVLFYTRWTDEYTQKHYGMDINEFISHWGANAVENGADGLILPGNRLQAVEGLVVPKLDPAIRMAEDVLPDDGQEQVSSPFEAIVGGADMLVVGSPIYEAPDPVVALIKYMGEVQRAHDHLALIGK